MFDLTVLDYVFVGVILASTIWATIRGGVYETIATLSWVVAAISARFASPWLDKMLQSWFDLTESTVGTLVASYFIVFFAVLILVGFLNQKFSTVKEFNFLIDLPLGLRHIRSIRCTFL